MSIDIPKTAREARIIGVKFYFTGVPCARGHIEKRTAQNNECILCARIKWNKFHEKNRHKQNAYSSDYFKKHREAILAKKKIYREKNKKIIAEKKKEWDLKNREQRKKYYEDNKTHIFSNARNRRSRIKNAEGDHWAGDIFKLLEKQNNLCVCCHVNIYDNFHVDHIMPIVLGGTNWPENLQLLCPQCNLRKSSKHPDVWARQNGVIL